MKKSLITRIAALMGTGGQPVVVPQPVQTKDRFNQKDRNSGSNRLSQKGRRKRARWTGNGK